MERDNLIENIKSSIEGKDVGYKEYLNWFYTNSGNMFEVDVGFLKIDCYSIAVDETHVRLSANKPNEEKQTYVFPISILRKFGVRLFR